MLSIILGIILIAHGLMYFLYMGQSLRKFELKPGMIWPDNSWAFSKILNVTNLRILAAAVSITAAVGFIFSGADLILSQVIWKYPASSAAFVASIMYILFWDGKMNKLADKGLIGILINIIIIILTFIM